MNVQTRFIILFEGRTGSSLLGNLLNQHPQVSCLGEEVAALRHEGWAAQRAWIESLFLDTANFRDPRLKGTATALGFKVKLREIADAKAFGQWLDGSDVKVVHQQRLNFVKQVVSSVRAMKLYEQTGHYNLEPDQANLKPGAYAIPKKRFNNTLLWLLEAEHKLALFLAVLTRPVLHSTYEDLCAGMNAEVARVFSFLGVSSQPVEPNTIKLTSDHLREVLENYDDLLAFYSGTGFEKMFTE